jgi:uncharacterized membrane protein YdbT with pleckstrin-like domain
MEEKIIFKGKPAGASYIYSILLLIICSTLEALSAAAYIKAMGEGEAGGVVYIVLFYEIFFVYIAYKMISRASQYCIITGRKLTVKKGLFFFKSTKELDLKEISSINIKKSWLENILSVGDLLLTTTKEDCPELLLLGFKNPEQIKDEIMALITPSEE